MKNYTPQARSLAHRVCNELAERPRVISASEIANMFDVPSSSVNASLRSCVQHGALLTRTAIYNGRRRGEYYPPGFTPIAGADAPAKPGKAPPLDIVMYDNDQVTVRGHMIGADDEGLAVFTFKQIAYLVGRVTTPVIEVTP